MEYTGERFLPVNAQNEMSIEHYQRYLFAKQLVNNAIVLDAACGEGYGSNLLSECAKQVIGIDIDKETIKSAQIKYENEKLSFIDCSIAKLPFEEKTFDVIVSFETIEHVDEQTQRAFLNEIKRVLKPDGKLIMSSPNKRVYTDKVNGENHFHVKELYAQEFLDFLETTFKYIEIYCQYPDVGYFLNRENLGSSIHTNGKCREDSRYLVAVCSNEKMEYEIETDSLACFSDEMYYFLYARVHELENTIFVLKNDSESFQTKQQEDIQVLQKRVRQMEKDATERNSFIEHLEKDIALQNDNIKEQDLQKDGYKKYIDELESQREEVKAYAAHLEKDIALQNENIREQDLQKDEYKKYIDELESQREEIKAYAAHLEKDIDGFKKQVQFYQNEIGEQKNYIAHLEKDIGELKAYVGKLEKDIHELIDSESENNIVLKEEG